MRLLTLFILFASTTASAAMYEYNVFGEAASKGWIPRSFIMDYFHQDSTKIISPKSKVFGNPDFTKGLFGSSQFSRGTGKAVDGEVYYYTIQLDFKERTGEIKLKMSHQGYRDDYAEGSCNSLNESGSIRGGSGSSVSENFEKVDARSANGAKASFGVKEIKIDIQDSKYFFERLKLAEKNFGSLNSVYFTEIYLGDRPNEKGYGAYDWRSGADHDLSVTLSYSEIIIKLNSILLTEGLRRLDKNGEIVLGLNTGRGWFTTVFYKKKGNWN